MVNPRAEKYLPNTANISASAEIHDIALDLPNGAWNTLAPKGREADPPHERGHPGEEEQLQTERREPRS